MAIKKLQNNFTTPEQSRRLLELGLPADSADCYYYIQEVNGKNVCTTPNIIDVKMTNYERERFWMSRHNFRYVPCWSVGRLIEIMEICSSFHPWQFDYTGTYIEQLIKAFDFISTAKHFNFSKLEE